MSRRKPRGISGMVRLTGGVEKAEFIPDGLPAAKDAIEKEICAGAARSMRFHGWNTWPLESEPRQLAENDFDFAFVTTGDPEYLDLAEVAPLKGVRGGYEGVPTTFARGKLVDAILRLVEKKDLHYAGRRRSKVHLLLYITDFRFLVSEGVVMLLKVALRRQRHGFASITYFAPIGAESGFLCVLHPAPGGVPYLNRQDEARMRAETLTNFDPRKWQHDRERGGFFQELPKG